MIDQDAGSNGAVPRRKLAAALADRCTSCAHPEAIHVFNCREVGLPEIDTFCAVPGCACREFREGPENTAATLAPEIET